MEIVFDIDGSISCPECGITYTVQPSWFKHFFNKELFKCSRCRFEIDYWTLFLTCFDEVRLIWGSHYGLLGCKQATAKVVFEEGKNYTLDFRKEFGDGQLLFLSMTPNSGGLFPVQLQSGVIKTGFQNQIHLRGLPFPGPNAGITQVNVLAWYATNALIENLPMSLLIESFHDFYEKQYRRAIISAVSAVEILQFQYFDKFFEKHSIGKERRRDFLENRATYGPQAFVLLPLLAGLGITTVPDERVLQALASLNSHRNDLIHRGRATRERSHDACAKELLSALMMVKYYSEFHGIQIN